MAASKVVPFFLIFISFALPLIHAGKPPKPAAALFIFGDSLFDPGNNNYINTTTLDQANFRPYGETYFDYPTGRFSDGRLISDFIAEHAKLPLIPPYLEPRNKLLRRLIINYHGVNFASAGAGALTETFHGSNGLPGHSSVGKGGELRGSLPQGGEFESWEEQLSVVKSLREDGAAWCCTSRDLLPHIAERPVMGGPGLNLG
ncbi:hypothetical protein RD792_014706 [Penstemon davidsonii]|uniref:Uncharacterized protein n=1 Tax=Penstemon davidsonii TaxID=160366 RepID=A0ABR0CQP1_9LAMI|nr:hypothetical protein RD792_014706 [Penstemon davidsonii]